MNFVDGAFQMRQSGRADTTDDDNKEAETDALKTAHDVVTKASNDTTSTEKCGYMFLFIYFSKEGFHKRLPTGH